MLSKSIDPGVGCRPDGSRYPFVVRCVERGPMGGYETREEAVAVAVMYQDQPRPKNQFTFAVERAA